jgi:glycosyltransferase involved in cell wall biosynthesis
LSSSRTAWIICQNAGSPRHGMNYRPYYIAKALVDRGWDITVISGSTSHEFHAPPATTGRYTMEEVDGVRYVWIRTPGYGESRSLGRMRAWASYLAGIPGTARLGLPEPAAILVSSPPPFPVLPAARLARRFKSRLVFEERDLWPLSLVEVGGISSRHPLIRLTQAVEDFALRRADLVVSVPPAAKGHFLSRGLPEDRLAFIPNGTVVPPEGAPEPEPAVRAALPGRSFIVGYAGKLGASNAMDAFVLAAGLLSGRADIGFAILGEGAEKDRLRELAARAGAVENLAFFPRVPRKAVGGYLAAFDACWGGVKDSPLYAHGISLGKIFEYMLAAKPIILSARAGNDPVSEAACGLTIPPEDAGALAAAIVRLAGADAAERSALGRAGRAHVAAHHDWKILGEQYARALDPGNDEA